MGFGLLFIGYFFYLPLSYNGFDLLPDIIGVLIMFSALRRLSFYCPGNRFFRLAKVILVPMGALSVGMFGCQAASVSGALSETLDKWLYTPLTLVYIIAIGVYHAFLLLGVYTLSKSVELPKLAARAVRVLSLTAVYYLLQLLSSTGLLSRLADMTSQPNVLLTYANAAVYLVGVIWMLLVWALIYTCYMKICLEGDEEMPYRDNLYDRIKAYLDSKKPKKK